MLIPFPLCTCSEVMQYSSPPESAYQRKLRAGATQLYDHQCDELDALNLQRCK